MSCKESSECLRKSTKMLLTQFPDALSVTRHNTPQCDCPVRLASCIPMTPGPQNFRPLDKTKSGPRMLL
jgi:hypothetical protein